ncbi:hypothetical protein ACA910_002427 [Epithemia clementina (nom. ined.)]
MDSKVVSSCDFSYEMPSNHQEPPTAYAANDGSAAAELTTESAKLASAEVESVFPNRPEKNQEATALRPGIILSEIESLPPAGPDAIGFDNITSKDIIFVGGRKKPSRNGSDRSDEIDFFGRPRPQNLVRKWPSMLLYLMAQAKDDEWRDVIDRVRTHPEEISILGPNGGANALHACCLRYPPLSVVKAIVEVDPTIVLLRNFNGETPLHVASYGSSEEVQKFLVQTVPDAAAMMDQYGDSPLHYAARAGATYNLMEAFLAAAPSMISQPNERGVTPLWLLPRSYMESDDLDEILDVEGEEYRDDWDNLALLLRYSYLPASARDIKIRDEHGVPLPLRREDFTWIVHAAAATPACPREVLRWLCCMFPEMATQRDENGLTPLLLAVRQKEMKEPQRWNQMEDGFREHVEVAEAELQNEDDVLDDNEAALNSGDSAFLERIFHRIGGDASEDGSRSGNGHMKSVVDLLLEWSPRSALVTDLEGRLPLTYALLNGLDWQSSVAKLIAAYPRALECLDPQTGLYNFQLAAMCSPQLDTVYSLVRSLPALLTCNNGRSGHRGECSSSTRSCGLQSTTAHMATTAMKRPLPTTEDSTATLNPGDSGREGFVSSKRCKSEEDHVGPASHIAEVNGGSCGIYTERSSREETTSYIKSDMGSLVE